MLFNIVLAMFGIAGLRTYEKQKGLLTAEPPPPQLLLLALFYTFLIQPIFLWINSMYNTK
jgi:hypothetical protein